MTHRLITIHAEADTVLVCASLWESLPKWLTDAFEHSKGKGIEKRREVVREITEHCEAHG